MFIFNNKKKIAKTLLLSLYNKQNIKRYLRGRGEKKTPRQENNASQDEVKFTTGKTKIDIYLV